MPNKFLIIDNSILPDIFEKVVKVKELLANGKVKDITEGVKTVGISRSTYYKYKDYVFAVSENLNTRKVIIALTLDHEPGTLSKILDKVAFYKGNILTINQEIPINNSANVNITFDMSSLNVELNEFLDEIRDMNHVIKLELVAMD